MNTNNGQTVMPTINGKSVTSVSKFGGNISSLWLEDGTEMSYEQVVSSIEAGQTTGLVLGGARDGSTTIRGVADGNPNNNLDNLPIH